MLKRRKERETTTTTATRKEGLCDHCLHSKHVVSSRGSTFVMCLMHGRDARFAKYPNLPVLQCAGHEEPAGTRKDS